MSGQVINEVYTGAGSTRRGTPPGGGGGGNLLPFLGPAVVASIAYIDPGNIAVNIQAGAGHGYELLWVVALANLVAMLFQALSAKLGIATGQNLAELCREHFPRPLVYFMWITGEVGAIATDLAEFLGAAIGFSLIFHWSLLSGMVVTAVVTYGILSLHRGSFLGLEIFIGLAVTVIGGCYLLELFLAPPVWGQVALHSVWPELHGADAELLAVGIIGATVMPHAIYLHSGLTQRRVKLQSDDERAAAIRSSNRKVVMTLAAAGLINMAMVCMAARVFHEGHNDIASIDTAYRTLVPVLGQAAGVIFLVALMASGISSSVVGTLAGQVIMQGFVRFTIPMGVRRLVTMLPAIAIVALGVDSTHALVLSQVVLSLVLPVPVLALIVLSRRRQLMRGFTPSKLTEVTAVAAALLIVGLNLALVIESVS
ncbi:MAG TPA: Nramp family divalent metal transporter [Stellaceae bacterium]|nr:Nramp family divalent metal transporter [Stellaceae bacterium]